MKKIMGIILALGIICATFFLIMQRGSLNSSAPISVNSGPKNATYIIAGQAVTLIDGKAEVAAAPGSATMNLTEYFGNEVTQDLNKDGKVDSVFVLTQNTGGSGTFYYVVVALQTATGYQGSQGFLLGDRVAPQTIEAGADASIVVNYVDRKPGENFDVSPSLVKTVRLILDLTTMKLADGFVTAIPDPTASNRSLASKTWKWVNTVYTSGSTTGPLHPDTFTLTFKAPTTFSATTDCNGTKGEYVLTGAAITFAKMVSTTMICKASQASDFSQALSKVKSFHFTSNDELVFELKGEEGTMIFN